MGENLEPFTSKNEQLLDKIDNRDKIVRAIELVVLGILVAFSVVSSLSLQNIINNNQQNTIEARKANAARQDELKEYIKCIVLLRYDNPSLSATSTRAEVATALDKCAKVQ